MNALLFLLVASSALLAEGLCPNCFPPWFPTLPPFSPSPSTTTEEPKKSSLECGEINPICEGLVGRISWGQEACPGQHPYMAGLYMVRGREITFFCGGVVIDEYHILTAASCVDNKNKSNTRINAILGDHSRHDSQGEQIIEVDKWIQHKSYPQNKGYNIALLKLREKINFKMTPDGYGSVNKICLPKKDDLKNTDAEVSTCGWGNNLNSNEHSDALQTLETNVLSEGECGQLSFKFGFDIVNGSCAKRDLETTCFGDFGGPFIHRDRSGRDVLAGIAIPKGNLPCSSASPAPFVKVFPHLAWIERQIYGGN